MTLLEKVSQTIEKEKLLEFSLHTNTLLVGVSGGPDSVCLLHLLTQLREKYSLNLIAAHLNHQLRGKESDQDETFVISLCKKWKVKFVSQSLNIRQLKKSGKGSLEEICREKRY